MPRHNPKTKITVRIDSDVMLKVQSLLQNPINGRTHYGHLSNLFERLLLDWVIKELEARKDTKKDDKGA